VKALLACLLLLMVPWLEAAGPLQQLQQLQNASLLVENIDGSREQSLRADQPMIPASTLKLLTAYLALETWGKDYRFHTDFYYDQQHRLLVKGYGDPFLVAEEIDLIVDALKQRGLKQVSAIIVDDSFFEGILMVDGQSNSRNPYDATPAALAANFNTAFVEVLSNGVIRSAEPQTPLTTTAQKLAASLPPGSQRINIGQNTDSARYFAEILQSKLRQQGVEVGNVIKNGKAPNDKAYFYRHLNSHNLSENLEGMLKYSTNFIANQIFLLLGAEHAGGPATLKKSQHIYTRLLNEHFHWQNFRIIEGAGLSRLNRLSARQLLDVLKKLAPYRHLLPEHNGQIRAKTGTLNGVSSYAGYIEQNGQMKVFALIINQPIDYEFRLRLAESLTFP
jgi:D-alanyl-D-alanine carboxypeptidase/D-alanyl-D-alanine-endopeptidase (penicillin-binding protein 4)